ncbi:MAG: DUF2214 family protein [Burkholderiales bacterium]
MLSALVAYLHYLALVVIAIGLTFEYRICSPGLNPTQVQQLVRIDLCYFGAAMLALATGVARVFWFGKGMPFYAGNPVFYIKLALFLAMGLISFPPTRQFLRWRRAQRAGHAIVPDGEVLRVRRLIAVELLLLAGIPLAATLMARGIGTPTP